jgi:hypothetical protein
MRYLDQFWSSLCGVLSWVSCENFSVASKIFPGATKWVRITSVLYSRRANPMATVFTRQDDRRQVRFTDEMFSVSPPPKPAPLPEHPHTAGHRCPFCEQPMPQGRTSILSLFLGGIGRFFTSLWMIVAAVLRFARFVVGGTLCLVGLLGAGIRAVGVRIAHPQDRCLLTGRRRTPPSI